MIDRIRTVTGNTFRPLILNADGPIAVEFMSYGCPHCGAIEPLLQQVADMIKTTEKVFRVNTGLDQDLAESNDIQGTPTLVMFLNGQEVGRVEGPPPTVAGLLTGITQPFEQ